MIILRKENNTRHTDNPKEAQEWMKDGYEVLKGKKQMASVSKKESKPKTKKIKKK
jgi:hypothetical protein